MNLVKHTCWGSMSDRIPSIETPQLRTAPFRTPHILLDVVGFTHDPIESPNLGYRADQIWGLAKFAPCEDVFPTSKNKSGIDVVTYLAARAQTESWVYRKFPVREFGLMREGRVWNNRIHSPIPDLEVFHATLDPKTARLEWLTHSIDHYQWINIPDNLEKFGPLELPSPRLLVSGRLKGADHQTQFIMSCADFLWYLTGYCSELLVGLMNGKTQPVVERFYREPFELEHGHIRIYPKNYNAGAKFAAAIELANILSMGKNAEAFLGQCGSLILKGLSPYRWPICPPRLILPFSDPFEIKFAGFSAGLTSDIRLPLEYDITESSHAINVLQIQRIRALRLASTIQVVVPAKPEKMAFETEDGVFSVTRAGGQEIIGVTSEPADLGFDGETLNLEASDFVPPNADIRIEKHLEELEQNQIGPKYQFVEGDVASGSFAEPFSSGTLHSTLEFSPDVDIEIAQQLRKRKATVARDLFGCSPKIPLPFHLVELVDDGQSEELRPEPGGDPIDYPLPDLARALATLQRKTGNRIATLGDDWIPVADGKFAVIEFPSTREWPGCIPLRKAGNGRNLLVMVCRVPNRGKFSYLMFIERRLRNGLYEGRPAFVAHPVTLLKLPVRLIRDILYFTMRADHEVDGMNGWPTTLDLLSTVNCYAKRLERDDPKPENMPLIIEELLQLS
ncbi:MAG TPA: hypothetical protein DCM48_22665 [Thalassospira sp.]|nr:hypothetical protein [Thalassospira sp.]